jgi:hypothetical protein
VRGDAVSVLVPGPGLLTRAEVALKSYFSIRKAYFSVKRLVLVFHGALLGSGYFPHLQAQIYPFLACLAR